MPFPAMLMTVAKRRALLRAATAGAMVMALTFGVVFCAFLTVLVAKRSSVDAVCISALGGQGPSNSREGGLEIRAGGREPVLLTPRQVTVARGYISVGSSWESRVMPGLSRS